MEINVRVAALHNAFKNVLHFVGKASDGAPVLETAHLVIRDNRVIVEATDRRKIIQILIHDFSDDVENFENTAPQNAEIGAIRADDVKMLEQLMRVEAKITSEIVMKISKTEGAEVLEFESQLNGSTTRILLFIDSQWPNIDSIFKDHLEDVENFAASKNYDIRLLRDVAKVQHTSTNVNGQNITIHGSGHRKPIHLFWELDGKVWAQGLLMPIFNPSQPELQARYF